MQRPLSGGGTAGKAGRTWGAGSGSCWGVGRVLGVVRSQPDILLCPGVSAWPGGGPSGVGGQQRPVAPCRGVWGTSESWAVGWSLCALGDTGSPRGAGNAVKAGWGRDGREVGENMGGPGEQGLGAYFAGISSFHFPVGLGVGEEGTRALEEGMIGEPWGGS